MSTRRATKAPAAVGKNRITKRLRPESSSPPRKSALSTGIESDQMPAAARNGHAELDKLELLKALLAFRRGDFSVRLAPNLSGLDGKIADALNDVLEINQSMAQELERINRVVGTE